MALRWLPVQKSVHKAESFLEFLTVLIPRQSHEPTETVRVDDTIEGRISYLIGPKTLLFDFINSHK